MAGLHLRQQIREGIAGKLSALTTTGARVFQSRVYPLEDSELPCLLISTMEEQIINRSEGSWATNVPRMTERVMDVSIKAVAKNVSNIDDLLDNICKEVEIALSADRFLTVATVNLTDDLVLVSTQINISGEAERPVGTADMVWRVTYWCNETTPHLKN